MDWSTVCDASMRPIHPLAAPAPIPQSRCDAATTQVDFHLPEQDPVMLWFTHLGVYHDINKNPRAWRALHTHPGYRSMKRANWIAAIIFFLIIWIF